MSDPNTGLTPIVYPPIVPIALTGFPLLVDPYTNVQAATYRDGSTFLETLETLKTWLATDFLDAVNTNESALQTHWDAEVTALTAALNTAITEIQNNTDTSNAALATSVNNAINSVINSTIAVTDPVTLAIISNASTATRQLIESIILNDHKVYSPIEAADYGSTKNLATLNAALDAAEARGKHTPVHLSGVWDVGNGLSMNGRSAVLIGDGGGGTDTSPWGTVIYASTQTGPVIDWTGWVTPTPGYASMVHHHGFIVQGDNNADATLAKSGMKFATMNGTAFSDISVRHTGGPCIDMVSVPGNAVYICDFERIALYQPVNQSANNVPFFRAVEPNGNRFRGFKLRCDTAPDIAPSGAVQILANATYSGHDNLFDAWTFEFFRVPTNGAIINHTGNSNIFHAIQFFDTSKASGASGTSYFTFNASTNGKDQGGNIVRGVIPGSSLSATDVDMGINMLQSRNLVEGVKGYKGNNVVIGVNIGYTDVKLGGGASGALNRAVVDNSGLPTNKVRDASLNVFPEGGTGFRRTVSGRYYGATNHTTSTGVMSLNVLYLIPFWLPHATVFNEIDVEVTVAAAASTIRLGIYDTDVVNTDRPGNLEIECGSVDSSTTGVKALATSVTLQAGLHWLGAVAQGGTPTVRTLVGSLDPVANTSFGWATDATQEVNCHWTSTSAALPSSYGGSVNVRAGAPKIMVKAQ